MALEQQVQHHYDDGGKFLRQRLLLATLTGTPCRVSRMHLSPSFPSPFPAVPASLNFSSSSAGTFLHPLLQPEQQRLPGVQPYEASLLRLLCSITEGSRVHIDAAGTTLTYQPGQLVGCDPERHFAAPLLHHCHRSKPISYYLEPLLLLAPFCKHPLHVRLMGVTDTAAPLVSRQRRRRADSSSCSGDSRSRSSRFEGRKRVATEEEKEEEEGSTDVATSGESSDDSSQHARKESSTSRSGGSSESDTTTGRNIFTLTDDPPIDFVRSVTIPTLQRLLRLATTTRRQASGCTAESSCSSLGGKIGDGGEEKAVDAVVRPSDIPDPFYSLRVVRRCCSGGTVASARGAATGEKGNGEVLLKTHGVLKEALQPFVWVDVGRVKRIRGTAFTAGGISCLFAKRCISKARGIFNDLLPDVWIYLEKQQAGKKGNVAARRRGAGESAAAAGIGGGGGKKEEEEEKQPQQGLGKGVGLALVAETIKGNYKGAAGMWGVVGAADEAAAGARGSSRLPSSSPAAADVWRATGNCKMALLLQGTSEQQQATAAGKAAGPTADKMEEEEGRRESAERGEDDEEKQEEHEAERLAETVAWRLLLEVQQGGVVDSAHQYMPLLFAALAEEHAVSKIRLSRLTPYTVQFIRHLRDFLGVIFHVEEQAGAAFSEDNSLSSENEEEEKQQQCFARSSVRGYNLTLTLKCVGVGLKNMARITF